MRSAWKSKSISRTWATWTSRSNLRTQLLKSRSDADSELDRCFPSNRMKPPDIEQLSRCSIRHLGVEDELPAPPDDLGDQLGELLDRDVRLGEVLSLPGAPVDREGAWTSSCGPGGPAWGGW